MPTPVMHLVVGGRLLADPDLDPSVRDRLQVHRAAFLLGNIAPDLQVVSGQPRRATHFFSLPLDPQRSACLALLQAHPALARPSGLPSDQAAFVAGYLAHLLFDEIWVREIFGPVFGRQQTWDTWQERLLWHNVLRTWIERQNLDRLGNGLAHTLRSAAPVGWLPFAADADLCRWRDEIADELEPGATLLTAQFFARRARVSEAEFQARLSPDQIEQHVFARITPAQLQAFHTRALLRSRRLVQNYLNGQIKLENVSSDPVALVLWRDCRAYHSERRNH